jgi:hypothetical protein
MVEADAVSSVARKGDHENDRGTSNSAGVTNAPSGRCFLPISG